MNAFHVDFLSTIPKKGNPTYNMETRNHWSGFLLMEKVDVNGPGAHPVYQFLKASTDAADIKWCLDCSAFVRDLQWFVFRTDQPNKV